MAFTRTRLHLIIAIAAGVVMALSAEPPLSSQESSVQLEVPVAPVIVNVDGVQQLVYELHATNLRREPITLQRLRVLADGRANEVADLQGVALAGLVGRAGLPRDADAALTIDPGRRSIVYLWSPINGARTPRAIQHQLELALGGEATTVVHDPPTRVSTRAVPVIDPPLAGGPWVAVYDPLLVGGHRTTLLAVDGRARIPGRFAIDWIRAPGTAGAATPVDATRGFVAEGFGAEVLAVANGRVADVRDGRPDLPPGERAPAMAVPLAEASGNHVVLDIGNGRFAVYEHLKRGSVVVTRGDRVRRGQVLAQLGSSGSTSIGPHLHFHVADGSAPLAAEGQPFVLRHFELMGRYASLATLVAGAPWSAADSGPRVRRSEHPAAVAVVRF